MTANGIAKTFNRRKIFTGISFGLAGGASCAITGRNGAGKSTLLKILCGVLTPTKGSVTVTKEGKEVPALDRHDVLGLVSPYLQMYEEFTGLENLQLAARIRGLEIPEDRFIELLSRVSLAERRNDDVRTYSSGMKQRLKYAAALLHQPPILLLDEPSSNLDAEGIRVVRSIMEEQKSRGILIVATNDQDDLAWCESTIDLNAPAAGGSAS
jgi:heme exporter protein A